MAEPAVAGLPELLAPAGSLEALKAAVSWGADAVYLGGRRFSARQYAGNFDDKGLAEAVAYAHARGVRVYAAVNTLIHDREIPDVARYLVYLAGIGVDAVLVQDPGLAALAREVIPGLPLHASTQMTIHNARGLEWAASLGLSRVVLARELSLGEVSAMGEAATRLGIGLEVFAHGALCYSYSGQCLLSSAIGGRSGNRGRCAQPCRRPYTLVRGGADPYGRPLRIAPVPLRDRYLLSTKDLSLYPYLDRVVRAPITALKIEGRMRSPDYVATVTGIYRRALDAIAAGAWAPSPTDEEALALTFNRGFTGGCLCEGPEGIMGRDAPDHRGVLAGIVEAVDPGAGSVAIRLTGPTIPEKGDGLLFREPGEEERDTGMILRARPRIEAGILWLKAEKGIRKGAQVFITRRARLARAGASPPSSSRISLDLLFRAGRGARPVLEGSVFRNGIPLTMIRLEGSFAAEPGRAHELTGEAVRKILSKGGESPYYIGRVSVEWPEGSYARKGAIGGLRRDLLAEVEKFLVMAGMPDPGLVARSRERLNRALDRETRPHPAPAGGSPLPTLAILTDSPDTLAAVVGEGSGLVALEPGLPPETLPGKARPSEACAGMREIIRKAMGIAAGTGWTFVWKWPRITHDDWLKEASVILGAAEISGLPGVMVEGPGAALAARFASPEVPIHGGAGLNAWNARAVGALSPLFSSITLSPELSREDLGDLASRIGVQGNPPLLGFQVQGNLEVMVSEDRVAALLPEARVTNRGRRFTGLRDGTGRIFPVEADGCGRTRILNPVETCLVDQLPALVSRGIGLLSIDARGRGPRYGREMAAIYREAIAVVEAGGGGMDRELDRLREECRKLARGGITRGAFQRGLREEPEGLS